jgi:hypothetical protein
MTDKPKATVVHKDASPSEDLSGKDKGDNTVPKQILLVAFDDNLLVKQRVALEQQGYVVTSALRLKEATLACENGAFDLFILGHSIPHVIKVGLVDVFRLHQAAPVLSLWEPGDEILEAVNYLQFSSDLCDLVRGVETILNSAGHRNGGPSSADSNSRVKPN